MAGMPLEVVPRVIRTVRDIDLGTDCPVQDYELSENYGQLQC